MRNHVLPAALAAILLGAGGAAMAQTAPTQTTTRTTTTTTSVSTSADALDETAIRSDITRAGYHKVKGLIFKDGVWQAKARGGNDKWSHIKIGPTTGKVYEANAPSRLNENEIKAKLTAQGYRNIDGVKFDRGLWKADARNPDGKKVDLLADPNDGSVVAVNQG